MKVFVKHLKTGKCPKGSKEIARKGWKRCKLSRVGMSGKKR